MNGFWEYCRDIGLANMISVPALAVSIWAILTSHSANKRSQETQSRLLVIEESRELDRVRQAKQARVGAKMEPGNRGGWELIIVNEGATPARNLQLIMDGKPLFDHPALGRTGQPPPALIGPQGKISYPIGFAGSCQPPFNLKIQWQDDSGVPGSFETTLDR